MMKPTESIPKPLLQLVILAGFGLVITNLLLVGAAHTLLKDEIDSWARTALRVSVQSKTLIVEQFLDAAREAADQAALRTTAMPALDTFRRGESSAAEVVDSLEPVLAEATRRSPGMVAITLSSSTGLIVSAGDPAIVELLDQLDGSKEFLYTSDRALFIVSHHIDGVGVERMAFDLAALSEPFQHDLGLGQGFDRRLVAIVDGHVFPVIPPGPLDPQEDAASLLRLMGDHRLLDGHVDPIIADEPLDGSMMRVSGTDLVVIIDVDSTSMIVDRRRFNFLSMLALGAVALACSGTLLFIMRRMSRAIAVQAAELAESRRHIESQAANLERSNADLERFAYIASHDLQEPVRMVRGFLELLERRHGQNLPQQAVGYVQQARSGAVRMEGMIRALLEYARLGATSKVDSTPVGLWEIVTDALANLKDAIERTAADVVVAPDLPRVAANREHIIQVVQNLVGNALKFVRDRKPCVRISAAVEAGWATVAIADNGIGMSREDQKRLFAMFSRLHGPNEYPGFGIGLATCKRVIERAGGRIWVESEPGIGSTFFFTVRVQ